MKYKNIVDRINEIKESDITMDTFVELNRIAKKLDYVHEKQMNKNKISDNVQYNTIKTYLNEVVFTKLKDQLGFSDDVINNIMYYINYGDRLDNIYVFDENIVARVKNYGEEESVNTYFIPNKGLMDITSKAFAKVSNNLEFDHSLVNSLNNIFGPMLELNKIVNLDYKTITYSTPRINIYLDSSITKMLDKYDDKFFYYNVNLIDNHLTLLHRDYDIYMVREMLEEKSKTK